jgi:rhodanese-related sulfurtransferase
MGRDVANDPRGPILDVRRIDRSRHLPAGRIGGNALARLSLSRMDEVPAGRIWVRCGSGYRAGVAASLLLQRRNGHVVHIDAAFDDASTVRACRWSP